MYQVEENENSDNYSSTFNVNIEVDYKSREVDDEADRDTYFREQILLFFQIEEYNTTIIDFKIDIIKKIVEESDKLKELSTKFANIMLQEKFDIGIVMFFAYDYFYLTFPLLKKFIIDKEIDENIYNNLIKIL